MKFGGDFVPSFFVAQLGSYPIPAPESWDRHPPQPAIGFRPGNTKSYDDVLASHPSETLCLCQSLFGWMLWLDFEPAVLLWQPEIRQIPSLVSQVESFWFVVPPNAERVEEHGPARFEPTAKPVALVDSFNCRVHRQLRPRRWRAIWIPRITSIARFVSHHGRRPSQAMPVNAWTKRSPRFMAYAKLPLSSRSSR